MDQARSFPSSDFVQSWSDAPRTWVIGISAICILPSLFNAFGVNFGPSTTSVDLPLKCGSIHTILEWTGVCAAAFTVMLSLVYYKVLRDVSVLIISPAILFTGLMGAFHVLASTKLIIVASENQYFIPFTDTLTQTCSILINIIGTSIFLFQTRSHEFRKNKREHLILAGIMASVSLIGIVMMNVFAHASWLPQSLYPMNALHRPWDVIPLIFLVAGGLYFYPRFYQRNPSLFSLALLLSVLPEIATQMHMVFGAGALYDNHGNIAHFLNVVAIGVPLAGLTLEYRRSIIKISLAEQSLRESEERYQIVSNTTNDVVWDWNLVTDTILWNSGMETLFHYPPVEVVSSSTWWMERIHPDDRERIKSSLHHVIETGHSLWSGEYRLQKKDGTYADILDRGHVVRDKTDKPIRMIGAMMDMSERKRLQATLINSEKMAGMGLLAAGVAHDINNPISVIMGFSQIVMKESSNNEFLLEKMKTIEREANRCKNLVQNLLAFSRNQKPAMKLVDAATAIEGALALVETMTTSRRVELIRQFDKNCPYISVDSNKIQQMLINLCTNAMDAMPDGGMLTVGLLKKESHIEIFVRDTGTGIPPEIRSRLFDPFFTTKEVGKGTGLGLSMAADIVKEHQGVIDVQSELGKGTTFTIQLPLNKSLISDDSSERLAA